MRIGRRQLTRKILPFVLALITSESALAQFNPNLKTKHEIDTDTLFEQCMVDLDTATRIVETCNATTYTAPHWYQQKEAVLFFVGLSLSLGFMAGQRLK